jgi:acetyl esterase/lipase
MELTILNSPHSHRLRMTRLIALFLFAAALVVPASAQVTIFSAFNLPGTIDAEVVKAGDNVPYADGPRFKLDVYVPDPPEISAPVVMFIYGGGWKAGDKFEYEFVGRALASQGFIVVIPDYRLYPEVKYPEFLEDNARAVKWIETNIASYGGDPQRLFLAGHSAGAYNAVMLGLDRSFLREFGVTVPIRAIAGMSGPYDFYPFEYDEVRNSFGEAPNPEGTQPVNLVTPDAPPMLLMSGNRDPIVRVQNTVNFAQKLKAQNVWVTTKYYDGFGHLEPVIAMGAMWRWRAPVLADMVAFFQRFGAFPSGAPRPVYTPEPPVGQPDIEAIVARLDSLFTPIAGGGR